MQERADQGLVRVTGPYRFVRLEGVSRWVLDDVPDRLIPLVVDQVTSAAG